MYDALQALAQEYLDGNMEKYEFMFRICQTIDRHDDGTIDILCRSLLAMRRQD